MSSLNHEAASNTIKTAAQKDLQHVPTATTKSSQATPDETDEDYFFNNGTAFTVELEQFITRTEQCDFDAISLADPLVRIHPHVRTRVLKILLQHLEVSKVPESRSRIDDTFKSRIICFMIIITITISETPSNEDNDLIEFYLPGIIKWCLYFIRADITSDHSCIEFRRKLLRVSPAGFFRFSQIPGVSEKLPSIPCALELAMWNWLLAETPGSDVMIDAALKHERCTILHYIITQNTAKDINLDRLIEAADGDLELLKKKSVARLASVLENNVMESDDVDAIVWSAAGLLDHGTTRTRAPFHEAGMIDILTKVYVKAARESNASITIGLACTIFPIVTLHLEDTIGFTWILEALNAGLMEGVLECLSKLTLVPNNDAYGVMMRTLLDGMLPQYFVYKSIVESAKKAIDALDYNKVKHSTYEPLFSRMRNLLEGRALLAKGDPLRYRAYCAKCLKHQADLKRCGRCEYTLYCSHDCQTADWNNGHKDFCRRMKGVYHPYNPDSLTASDRRFVHELIHFDVMCNRVDLGALARKKYPNTRVSELIITADYTMTPRDLDILTADDVNTLIYTGVLMKRMRIDFEAGPLLEMAKKCARTLVIGMFQLGMYAPGIVVTPVPSLVMIDETVRLELDEDGKKAQELFTADKRPPTDVRFPNTDYQSNRKP
ncbi:hypothetical protein M422DRAFT_245902 [Sphaerobolus stellatus SS14]|nr:hypothetical protein M422DRAFT_245902 [Sphaerobolus stellatus SS14]